MNDLSGHKLRRLPARAPGRLFAILLILLIPLLLGAWRDISGNTINPRFVQRIQDGKTTRHEILLWFGDPKESERGSEGPIYKYSSYKDAPADMPYQHDKRKIQEQSDSLYLIDDDKKIRKPVVKTEGKILRSTLTIRFKPDGETVMSHEYKEF